MNDKINDLLTAHYAQEGKNLLGEDAAVREVLQAIEAGRDSQSTGAVSGEKPLVNAGEGSKVYVHTNGNGNGHAEMQKAFNSTQSSSRSIRVYLQQHYCVV